MTGCARLVGIGGDGASGGICPLPACLSRRRRRSPFFGVGSKRGAYPEKWRPEARAGFGGLVLGFGHLTLEPEGAGEGLGLLSGNPDGGPQS